jgi:hypothetical protein
MFTTNFVRDLNAKVATMGDGGRGCVSEALHRETVIRPLTEHPRLSAESIAEATYQLGLSRSILYKLLQRYERSVRHRKSLNMWKSFLAPLTPEARRSLARISRAWPSALQGRLASSHAQHP